MSELVKTKLFVSRGITAVQNLVTSRWHRHHGYWAYRRYWDDDRGGWVRERVWIPYED
jgi:hypothetical protein